MKRLLSAAQMRAVDAAAEEHGVPSSALMERAGMELFEAALAEAAPSGRFVVFCGPGNNGGDGLVAARLLKHAGREVSVALLAEPAALLGDARANCEAAMTAGVAFVEAPLSTEAKAGDVVIDALFGTGLSRPPTGDAAGVILHMVQLGQAGARVVAADLPSGLQADTGVAFDPCVAADVTVTFAFAKTGHAQEPGATASGRLSVVDIGIPQGARAAIAGSPAWLLEESDARARLPPRQPHTHKGTYGHVLVIAGSAGKTGAAALTAFGALRAGAGLVTVASRSDALASVLAHAAELMGSVVEGEGPLGLSDLEPLCRLAEGKQALVFGPGLARGPETGALLARLVAALKAPILIDADGLNALSGQPELLSGGQGGVLLTPHPGEAGRLLGLTSQQINADRLGAARQLAKRSGAITILKGARSVIAQPDGAVFINPTGNAGMATAGSGDVLSGIGGALLAQGLSPLDAAVVGAYAHGSAGDLAVKTRGALGLVASDLLEAIGHVWVSWGR